jgi:hypothetical protein
MAYYEDIEVDQGASVKYQIQLLDVDGERRDLSDYRARGRLNRSYDADSDEGLDFFVNIDSPPQNGVINFSLTPHETHLLDRRRYVYDIEIEYQEDSDVTVVVRILEGKVLVSRSVTNKVYHSNS